MPKPLRNTTSPKLAKQHPIDKYPYMILRPHGDPTFHTGFKVAQNRIREDLDSLLDSWQRLMAQDAIAATSELLSQVGKLNQDGGKVEGVCDPHTGMRYVAELVRRKEI